jgi:hypothetical protein
MGSLRSEDETEDEDDSEKTPLLGQALGRIRQGQEGPEPGRGYQPSRRTAPNGLAALTT